MNKLTLAVAGSRKTQSIVDSCASKAAARRLVVTFTLTGQAEIQRRLQGSCQPGAAPEVLGWYAFLMRHWIRPFLPTLFSNKRLRGLNFDGDPGRYAKGEARYFDRESSAFKLHLSKLATEVAASSDGAAVDRLSRIYDEIYIDEVQDLTGCDLHLLDLMIASDIKLVMVGDIRQSVFDTNPRDPNLKQYRGIKMLEWFREREERGVLAIEHSTKTWRSNAQIAAFSDSLFPAEYGFKPTESMNAEVTNHSGVFAVSMKDVDTYIREFQPLCLRNSSSTATTIDAAFINFGKVKGVTEDRVLILPTAPICTFLISGKALTDTAACRLYVAVTRARHSVAIAMDKPTSSGLTIWAP